MARILLLFLVVAASCAGPAAPSPQGSPFDAAPGCPGHGWQGVLGVACRVADGLFAASSLEGIPLGTLHGPDPVPDVPDVPLPGPFARAPACVEEVGAAAAGGFILVVYARAVDDDDRYAAKVATIRSLVRSSNGLLHDAAAATGGAANLRVHCDEGVITVRNETLPTAKANARWGTVTRDLILRGYARPDVKYWVYYDDPGACRCAGAANLWGDDSTGPANLNNGLGPLPMFAVDFGYDSTIVMLHELGHTLGAVQNSAPHSTLAGHCTDGRDVMCYNDGGPRGPLYTTAACATTVFDCGRDDYFNSRPANGTYLATHWNIGDRWNRFLDFADTVVGPVPAP